MPTPSRPALLPRAPLALAVLLFALSPLILPGSEAAGQDPGLRPARASAEPHDPQILPGDQVRLWVWREEDMKGDYLVDAFGVLTLPLVGDISVLGETQRTLKARLEETYSREIRDLALSVVVLKRVRVGGEVKLPGILPLETTMTVADALALAGGRDVEGRSNQFLLRRAGETVQVKVLEDAHLYELFVETGDEILVLRESWFSRHSGTLMGSVMGLIGVLGALAVR